MPEVTIQDHDDLTDAARAEIGALLTRVFVPPGTRVVRGPGTADGRPLASPAERLELPDGRVFERPALVVHSPRPGWRHFTVWEGSTARAHAETFRRRVRTSEGPRDVVALAGVCVEVGLQGSGLGATVVGAAFADQVSSGTCALFQTGVPGFYEKLGCRLVGNRFVNGATALDPAADAFWDRFTMVYPADTPWPDGTIDLNGPGF